MLKLVFRVTEDPVTAFAGLLLGANEDVEREAESGAGSGKEDDRFGLGLDEPWGNPQEGLLVIPVLIAEGLVGREGDEDPGKIPAVNRCRGLKLEPDLELDNDERGDERGDARASPLA